MLSRKIFSALFMVILLSCLFNVQAANRHSQTVHKFFYRGVYVESNVGVAASDWSNYAPTANFNITKSRSAGFVFDIDSGYQYNRYLGFEAGWYHLPTAKYITTDAVNFTVSAWFVYLSLKLLLPVYREFYLFTKAGFSYRCTEFTSSPPNVPPDGDNISWQPVFAVGGQVYINPNWFLVLQYMYVPSRTWTTLNNNTFLVPRSNLITIGVAYKFAV